MGCKGSHFKDIKHDYFDNIDSNIKAYLLGFFVADGTLEINWRGYHSLRVVQKVEDNEIIKLFQSEISPQSKLELLKMNSQVSKPQNRINIVSEKIGQALIHLGFPVRKTYYEYGLPDISKKLLPDFIRGYFDGDGTVNAYISKDGYVVRQVRMVGNCLKFFNELQDYLHIQGVTTTLKSYKGGNLGNIYHYLSIRGDYNKWYQLLYPGITTFDRKQEGCRLCTLTSSEIRKLKEPDPCNA